MQAVSRMMGAMWVAAALAVGVLAQCGGALAAESASAAPAADRQPDAQAKYDLIVLVYAPDVGPAQVAVSYPRVVDHGAIQKGVEELAQRTGARISNLQLRDAQQGQGMTEIGTAVEFGAAGLIQQAQGALPVGPIIRSLPDWRHMRLVFVVGGAFRWTGPRTTTADGFAVRVVSSMKPIEYDVEREMGGPAPPAARTGPKPDQWRAALPAVLIGLPAGFMIGWLVFGERQSTAEAQRRRGKL